MSKRNKPSLIWRIAGGEVTPSQHFEIKLLSIWKRKPNGKFQKEPRHHIVGKTEAGKNYLWLMIHNNTHWADKLGIQFAFGYVMNGDAALRLPKVPRGKSDDDWVIELGNKWFPILDADVNKRTFK